MIAMVKNIPAKYFTHLPDKTGLKTFNLKEDIWYGTISHYDTSAIAFLINLITDTTNTGIVNSCTKEKYKIGDIAVLLINDIEPIPYATVTSSQWCVFSSCSVLPDGFIRHVAMNRQKFKAIYEKYYYSDLRQDFVRSAKQKK